jgi:hypothetical protein
MNSVFPFSHEQRGDWALLLLVEISFELFSPTSSSSSSSSSSTSYSTCIDEVVHLLHVALLGVDHVSSVMRQHCYRMLTLLALGSSSSNEDEKGKQVTG